MSTVIFRRPPAREGPELPQGEIALQEPPALGEAQAAAMSSMFMYLPMAIGSGAMVLMFIQPGAKLTTYLGGGLMALSGVGMMLGQLSRTAGERKRRLRNERRDYIRYLGQVRKQTRKAMSGQREAMAWSHPDPAALWNIALSDRLWERRVSAEMFGTARIGVGQQRLSVQLRPPQTKPVEDLEPLCASALRRFVRAYAAVPGLPTVVVPRAFARILLDGDTEVVRGVTRALLAQLVTFHSPEDLMIAVCVGEGRRGEWDWVKWLPHAQHPAEQDAAGQVRMVTDSYPELEQLFGEAFAERPRFEPSATPRKEEPYVVIVLDGAQLPPGVRIGDGGFRNATVVDLGGSLRWKADRHTLRLRVGAEKVEMVGSDRVGNDTFTQVGRPDQLSLTRARSLAALISPYRLGYSTDNDNPLETNFDLTALLGIDDARTFEPSALWATRSPWDRLCVPIGISEDGNPVELDIKESAQGGMGPHGMLIGATGSGKSELLRTLVLSLALTHSSEVLNLVLVDFKGGATFIGFDQLPHTSAVITNLADELPLVDRMQDAVHGELIRRQELLRQAGYSSLLDYEKARMGGAALDPLPTLFIVVDEFSELLAAKREFMDLFVMIGRLGRSLGVHLLLASQRLDEGRVHQLESHLSYRVALRTFSDIESRSILGVGDAYELPTAPGNGYLKTNTTTLVRFKASYVSGPYRPGERRQPQSVVARRVVPFRSDYIEVREPAPAPVEEVPEVAEGEETLLQLMLDRLRGQGPPARRIWLPPLAESPSLDRLIERLTPHPEFGLCPADRAGQGTLSVPVGVVDKPFDGVRELLNVDLAGGAGHVGIVGGPQSGKTTLVRTLITGLALTHTPREAQFYCLDFGGGGLAPLSGLPHVGAVASRLQPDLVGRTIAELSGVLAAREQDFADHGISSMVEYRSRRRNGEFADDPYGDVFLVIDGWFTLRQTFDHLEDQINHLTNRGLNYGIHVVISATRWSEIRAWLRDLMGTRLELHLGDPTDSEVGSRAAAGVPAVPGRGITTDKYHFLAALPRIDASSATEDIADASREVVRRIAEAWPGGNAPGVRMLPPVVRAGELPPPEGDLKIALGLDDQRLGPVWHDFEQTPHLMIFGDTESGKTNLLRLIAQGIMARYPAGEARIMLADYRRNLANSVPQDRQLGYAVNGSSFAELVRGATQTIRERVPGPDISPDRLAKRDWWTGPRLFVLVDDYDLLASPGSAPLEPMLDLLPQGTEIGLHLVIARASSGAGRVTMTDQVIRRMWDLGNPGLVLSCSREEGSFLGSELKPRKFPPGRGQLVHRRGSAIVQTGLVGDGGDSGEAGPAA